MRGAVLTVGAASIAASSFAQAPVSTPAPVARVTFPEAIRQAQERNPTVATAAAGILRAEGLLRQARSTSLLQITGNVTNTLLNTGVQFSGQTVVPRDQVTASLNVDMPILAAAAWARKAQAEDAKGVAELSAAETRRQVAFATADAYLAIIAQRRVVDGNVRARDTAKAHFDLATELERRGQGSKLNALRAQQQVSQDEGLVETARLALYRAQEALGVLIVVEGPADAADEPDLTVGAEQGDLRLWRTDLKLFTAQQQAAERVVHDSRRDWIPTIDAIFRPQTSYPAQLFAPQNSWQFLLQGNVPIFDSGQRASTKLQRQSDLDRAKATLTGGITQANSEVRSAREAVSSGERLLTSAQAAADQAQQVVGITNISFRAGAATNIEVIDAERVARDADTSVAVAEDQLRRARLELLNALGRFPQ